MIETVHSDRAVWASRAKVAFGIFALVGAFFLVAEHRAHVLPFLPWLLLAACPLMHIFMHGGHGGHHHGGGGQLIEHLIQTPKGPFASAGGPCVLLSCHLDHGDGMRRTNHNA